MININSVIKFFGDVVARSGFILSADTLNSSHLGPKFADILVKLDPDSFYDIMRERQVEYYDHRWGKNAELDDVLLTDLWDLMEHVTTVASFHVKDLQNYSFGCNEYDGALIGWWLYEEDSE